MANNYRGEVDMIMAGRIYTMRPTFSALCEIEDAIGKSLLRLLSDYDAKGITIKEQVAVVRAGIKAGGQEVPASLEEIMKTQGFARILPLVCKFLEEGLNL